MAHHAYLYVGDQQAGIAAARRYGAEMLHLAGSDNPDIAVFAYEGLFPIDHARRVIAFASQGAAGGGEKLIVIAAGRIFHEAQNALLKLFEEPPAHTTLVLVVPAAGIILPTLRSRLIALPREQATVSVEAQEFLAASAAARAKIVAALVAKARTGKDEEKQAARMQAVRLCEGLIVATHATPPSAARDALLRDLDRFLPLLHTASAPLKLIFEHLLLVIPASSGK
ncbi:MAG TPA: hypothetical protein VGE23_01380 [Candidatus Paceibacterota bacterium]